MRELLTLALSFFMMVLLPFVVVAVIILACFAISKLLDLFNEPEPAERSSISDSSLYYYETFDAATPQELQRKIDDFKAKAHKDRNKFYSLRTTGRKKNG